MDEVILNFIQEANDYLERINDLMLKLDKEKNIKSVADDLLRVLHTFKGASKMVELSDLSEILHSTEEVIKKLKDEIFPLNDNIIELLFEVVDSLYTYLGYIAGDLKKEAKDTLLAVKPKLDLFANFSGSISVDKGEEKNDIDESKEDENNIEDKNLLVFDPKNNLDLVQDFILESEDILQNLNTAVLNLEKDKSDENINNIFRYLHTLKGNSALIEFKAMNLVAHKMETLLDKVRNKEIELTEDIIDMLFEVIDLFSIFLEDIKGENIVKYNISDILYNIEELINNKGKFKKEKKEKQKKEDKKSNNTSFKQSKTVRVNIEKLNTLMNLVGELAINKIRFENVLQNLFNFVSLHKKDKNFEDLANTTSSLLDNFSRLIGNLQESVMDIRLVPLDFVFKRFPRMIRDIAKISNKEVEFIVTGGQTQVDKTVIEEIGDPLIHLMRNSIDHGIEPVDERIKAGKSEKGKIELNAFYQGDSVYIEVKDDGRGIDVEKVKKKALEKGLITEEEFNKLTDEEAINLIFKPGFSTADKITDISGRGVGMDVVMNIINKINGSIQVYTQKGKGTRFLLQIPLTLAIIKVLIVKVGEYKVAIPLSVVEELRLLSTHEISIVGEKEVMELRGKVIPLIYLSEMLDIDSHSGLDDIYVVITKIGEKEKGIVIDDLIGFQEVVIKDLGSLLKKVKNIMGVTILGDGSLILILDIAGILADSEKRQTSILSKLKSSKKSATSIEQKKVLIVEDSSTIRMQLKKYLQDLPVDIYEAENGKIAFSLAKKQRFDFISTDIMMPEMDGYELVKNLRKLPEYIDIPIIALSSKGEKVDKIKGFDSGIDDYLVKPITKELYLAEVKRMLRI